MPQTKLALHFDAPPLRVDPGGAVRVGGTRVLLEIVIEAFQRGETAESIVQMFPTLSLADTYAAIAYYLNHREEVDAYVEQCREEGEKAAAESRRRNADLGDIRARLLARKNG